MEPGHGGLYLYFVILQLKQEDFCELEVCLVSIVSSKKTRSETLSQKRGGGETPTFLLLWVELGLEWKK